MRVFFGELLRMMSVCVDYKRLEASLRDCKLKRALKLEPCTFKRGAELEFPSQGVIGNWTSDVEMDSWLGVCVACVEGTFSGLSIHSSNVEHIRELNGTFVDLRVSGLDRPRCLEQQVG